MASCDRVNTIQDLIRAYNGQKEKITIITSLGSYYGNIIRIEGEVVTLYIIDMEKNLEYTLEIAINLIVGFQKAARNFFPTDESIRRDDIMAAQEGKIPQMERILPIKGEKINGK